MDEPAAEVTSTTPVSPAALKVDMKGRPPTRGWQTQTVLLLATLATLVAVGTGIGIGVAIGKASESSDDDSCAPEDPDRWCYQFDPAAYNNSGAWVPQMNLRDIKAWDWEHGYWVGKLSYYGADKEPNESPRWPYKYDHYLGFLRLCVKGSEFIQRNIFVYPPQSHDFCVAHGYHNETTNEEIKKAPGGGTCGTHGNEKLWEVGPLFANDCKGSIEGPYKTPFGTYFTNVSIVGPNVVLYNVFYPTRGEIRPDENSILFQNQVTSFENNGASRFRTAQGLFPTKSLSYYTEDKVSRAEFYSQLAQARADFKVRDEDLCKFDGYGMPMGLDADGCAKFFDTFFEDCDEP